MFNAITLRGRSGAVLYGHRTAAAIREWTIKHHRPDDQHAGHWTLSGRVDGLDQFMCSRSALLFTAPRAGGYWVWPITKIQITSAAVKARLGPPEQ